MIERLNSWSVQTQLLLLTFLLFWLGFGIFSAWFILNALSKDQIMVVVGMVLTMSMFLLTGAVFTAKDYLTMRNNLQLLNQDDMDEQMTMVKLMQMAAAMGNNRGSNINLRMPQGGRQAQTNPTYLFPPQQGGVPAQQPVAYEDALSIE